MSRNARQEKILELIKSQEIETQDELCACLSESGFPVTQATVSRDIKELHLIKIKGVQKRFRYTAARERGDADKSNALFRACVVDIRAVGNLIVVKTLAGSGANAGVVVDAFGYNEVVGSIAGDDTLLLICETAEDGKRVTERLEALVRG